MGSLRQIIDACGPLPEKIVAEVAESILSALEYLHHQGITHRDLKAANVLVDANGRVKLGDFGVALQSGDAAGKQNTITISFSFIFQIKLLVVPIGWRQK